MYPKGTFNFSDKEKSERRSEDHSIAQRVQVVFTNPASWKRKHIRLHPNVELQQHQQSQLIKLKRKNVNPHRMKFLFLPWSFSIPWVILNVVTALSAFGQTFHHVQGLVPRGERSSAGTAPKRIAFLDFFGKMGCLPEETYIGEVLKNYLREKPQTKKRTSDITWHVGKGFVPTNIFNLLSTKVHREMSYKSQVKADFL